MPVQKNLVSEDAPKKRSVAVPGEVLATGEDYLPSDGARREGSDIIATRFGLAEESGRVVKVLPMSGAFVPRRGNSVIGRVTNITSNGWVVDIDWAANAFIPLDESPRFINKSEMDQFLAIGDAVSAKIWSLGGRGIDLTLKGPGLGRLEGGFIFKVNQSRVPRIIGREGSMISLIKTKTNTNIVVGQNGWVWVKSQDAAGLLKARTAIEKIAREAYKEGLTEQMETWLEEQK